MTREGFVEVDDPDPLRAEPHGELAREALVPRIVREAPDIDHILVRVHDPVLPHPVTRVQVELDPAVAVGGGGGENLDDKIGRAVTCFSPMIPRRSLDTTRRSGCTRSPGPGNSTRSGAQNASPRPESTRIRDRAEQRRITTRWCRVMGAGVMYSRPPMNS